jgi:hypothetical protein
MFVSAATASDQLKVFHERVQGEAKLNDQN